MSSLAPPLAWLRHLAVVALSVPFVLALRTGLRYALGPTPAERAEAYVLRQGVRPLTEPLARLLSKSHPDAATQDHPLLGQAAPGFDLPDEAGRHTRLADYRSRPVVLVFYYGYYCPHCVAQLFALDKDAALFHELGAEIVAVSADPPEETAARFRSYGRFQFPVLSDAGNRVAETFEVYTPEAVDRPESLKHATFVLAPDGGVRWAYRGSQPFLDNRTLIREVARCVGASGSRPEAPLLPATP